MNLNTPTARRAFNLARIAADDMAEAKARYDAHIAALVEMVGSETGTHTVSFIDSTDGKFVVSENNTYDKDVMLGALLPGQVRRCSKTVLDSAMVKAAYPQVYAQAKQSKGVKVSLKA